MTSSLPEDFLSSSQLSSFHELKAAVLPTLESESDRSFCSDYCFRRYLRARDFKVKEAEKMLQATLAWRREARPELIEQSEISGVVGLNTVYIKGVDRNSRPVIYMKPGAANPYPAEQRIKFMAWLMEQATWHTNEERGVEKMVWVLDFVDFGSRASDADSKATSRATLDILQNHYPERLGLAFLINTPFYFNLLWMIISPFINSVTRNKVRFISGDAAAIQKELLTVISQDQLDEKYGGSYHQEPAASNIE